MASKHGTNQRKRSSPKVQRAKQLAGEVRMEKNVVKKGMRSLRRSGDSHEDVATLAQEFQHLIWRLSKLNKVVKVEERRSKASKQCRECQKDIHKFAKAILDDDNCAAIEPTFSKETAEGYFRSTYVHAQGHLSIPHGCPNHRYQLTPWTPFPFNFEEIEFKLQPQPTGPGALYSVEALSIPDACTATPLQHPLDQPGHPHSVESWNHPTPWQV